MENWKAIKDFQYEVSNLGNIRNSVREKPLKSTLDKTTGYMKVKLFKKNKGSTRTVHKLVAQQFLENPKNLPVIDHIDGNKCNNNVTNLRYCTWSQNHMNVRKKSHGKNKFKGVRYIKKNDRWAANVNKDGKSVYCRWFKTELEAVQAYNENARKFFGEFAKLNVI